MNSAAARAVALRLAAEHPRALVVATPIRLPGIEPTFVPTVALRPAARLDADLGGEVVVLQADAGPTYVKAPRPAPAPKLDAPPRRVTNRDRAIALLSRPEGTSVPEMMREFGIASHSARSMLSVLRRDTEIERTPDNRYRLPSDSRHRLPAAPSAMSESAEPVPADER